MKLFSTMTVIFGLAAVAALSVSNAAHADVSFKGKRVELMVASDPGGGTDRIGRLIGQHIEKYLPGNPTIVVKNTGAGGGKIRAANLLMKSKPDGLLIMQSDTTTLQPSTLKRKSARYDPKEFRIVGSINRGGSILFIRKDVMDRLKDKSKNPVIVGAISGTRSWQAMPMWGAEFLGWNMKWVPGYKGTGALTKALRQGEIDVFATNNLYVTEELRKDGVIELLAQEGQPEGETYGTRSGYPDVTPFPILLKNANLPKVAWSGYQSIMAPSQIDKWMSLPPKTPEDITKAWRSAYAKVVKDPEFQKVAHKQISEELFYIPGETVEEMIREVHSVGDDALKYAENLKKKYGLIAR